MPITHEFVSAQADDLLNYSELVQPQRDWNADHVIALTQDELPERTPHTLMTTLTDGQVKGITTPILLLPAVPLKMYYTIKAFLNAHIIAHGGVSVTLNIRYEGTTQLVTSAFTLVSSGLVGYRNTLVTGAAFNILTATDYANRGIEVYAGTNAGASFETESGTHLTMNYCLLPAD